MSLPSHSGLYSNLPSYSSLFKMLCYFQCAANSTLLYAWQCQHWAVFECGNVQCFLIPSTGSPSSHSVIVCLNLVSAIKFNCSCLPWWCHRLFLHTVTSFRDHFGHYWVCMALPSWPTAWHACAETFEHEELLIFFSATAGLPVWGVICDCTLTSKPCCMWKCYNAYLQ